MSVEHHEQLRNDLAGFALGSLDAESAARVEAHVQDCVECQQALMDYQGVLDLLPLGLPIAQPSVAARSQLISRTHSIATSVDSRSGGSRAARWSRLRRGGFGIATALLLVLGVAAWERAANPEDRGAATVVERIRNDPTTVAMPMSGGDAAPGATGNLFVEPGKSAAALVANGLPQPPAGRTYQFWFVRSDQTHVSGGIFQVDQTGGAVTLLSAPADFGAGWSCGVSEEPSGGSVVPTGRNILRAAYDGGYKYTR